MDKQLNQIIWFTCVDPRHTQTHTSSTSSLCAAYSLKLHSWVLAALASSQGKHTQTYTNSYLL